MLCAMFQNIAGKISISLFEKYKEKNIARYVLKHSAYHSKIKKYKENEILTAMF